MLVISDGSSEFLMGDLVIRALCIGNLFPIQQTRSILAISAAQKTTTEGKDSFEAMSSQFVLPGCRSRPIASRTQ